VIKGGGDSFESRNSWSSWYPTHETMGLFHGWGTRPLKRPIHGLSVDKTVLKSRKNALKTKQKRLNFTFCSTRQLSPRQNPMPSSLSFQAPETCQAHFLHFAPEIPRLFFNLQVEPLRTRRTLAQN
jgi:hypothetical protein